MKKHKHTGGKHSDLMPKAKRSTGHLISGGMYRGFGITSGPSHPANTMDGTMPPCPGGSTPPGGTTGGGAPPVGGGM